MPNDISNSTLVRLRKNSSMGSSALLRKAQDELLETVELQVGGDNQAAFKLCQLVGFEQVDAGRCYQRGEPGA